MIFSSPNDIILKNFREISIWLQSDWYTHIAQLPENSREVEDDAMSSNCSGYAAFDDTTKYFVDDEEEPMHAENDDKCEKEKSNKSSKKNWSKKFTWRTFGRNFLNAFACFESFR